MKEEQPVFKVTDRRLFNADGTPRDILPEEKPAEKAEEKPQETMPAAAAAEASSLSAKPSPTSASATVPDQAAPISEPTAAQADETATEEAEFDEAGIPDAEDPASFINFAMSIASNAASSLGLMEHPVTRKREVDLELGKHWIDVLGMLQRKTQGNLTPQEAQIVEAWLADLRMQYVSLTSASSPKAAGTYTGRDIIGGK